MIAKLYKIVAFALIILMPFSLFHATAKASDQTVAAATDRGNDSAAPDAKSSVPFQPALDLIQQAAAQRDPKLRDQLLDQAQANLKQWLTANSNSDEAIAARMRLGELLRYRAANLLKADQTTGDITGSPSSSADGVAASKAPSPAQQQAQSLLQDALGQFEESAKQLRAELDAIPKGEQTELRTKIGLQWLDARLSGLASMLDCAQTFAVDAPQRKQSLNSIIEQGASLYQRFPKLTGGWLAHYYEAQSYEALGDTTKSLATYQDLLIDLTDADTGFRPIKTQAMRRALALWLATKDYSTAVDKSLGWAESAKGDELLDPDWLAVKLSTATALKGLADSSGKKDSKSGGYLRDARELLGDVVKAKNPQFQQPARDLLAQLNSVASNSTTDSTADIPKKAGNLTSDKSSIPSGGNHKTLQLTADTKPASDATEAPVKPADLKTFDAAFDKASEAADDMLATQEDLNSAQQDDKPDAKHIEELKRALDRKQKDLLPLCQRAIELSSAHSNLEKLNKIRYLVCYFNYTQHNYYDSAVVGETLARTHPDAADAVSAARVAMAALDALARNANQGAGDASFETTKLQSLAEFIVAHWPKEPEAGVAMEVLLNSTLTGGDFDKALKMIDGLPPDSPARAQAEVRLGHALWTKYLRRMQELRAQKAAAPAGAPAGGGLDDPKIKSELGVLVAQAQKSLEHGLAALAKADEPNPSAVLAAIPLTQLYVNQSLDNKAVTLLENAKYGPLTLVAKNDPATQTEGVPAEIYRVALRAYVGADPQQLDKATSALNSLEKIYAADPAAQVKLTQLLISIAVDLQQQLDELSRQGDQAKITRLEQAFDHFLDRVANRSATADYNTLKWVANTYETLGEKISQPKDSSPGKPSPEAADAYRKAVKIYVTILERAKADPTFMPANQLLAVKQSLAIAARSAGDYAQSIDAFADMLKDKPNLLQTQIEAVRTYQLRGANENADWYASAIDGGTGPAASIWGWGKMASKIASNAKYRDLFHEARYNIALCHQKFGESLKNADDQNKQFQMAKDAIRTTKQFESTFDDGKWKPQNEKLLRELQKQLDQPVVGLLEFEPKAGASPDNSKNPATN